MKKSIKYYFIIVFIVLFVTNNIIEGQTKVTIKTNSATTFCVVDDSLSFTGGVITFSLNQGVHYIKLKRDKFCWNCIGIRDTLNITGEKYDTTMVFHFPQQKLLTTIPDNFKVMKDDSTIGYTPQYFNLSGKNSLRLYKRGYEERTVYLSDMAVPIQLKPLGKDNEKSFMETHWFKILLGSAAVLGAATAYFKTGADRKYDDYLSNGNNELLDETNRLDLFAGVSLGLLEINIGYLIYRMLSD